MKSETCAKCGQEVRYGTRSGVTGWLHREQVDHVPLFGAITTPELRQRLMDHTREALAEESEEAAEAKIIPPPEVRAVEIFLGDERMPGGAKDRIKQAEKLGWTTRATYSRGPRQHASQGTLLGISDCVVVRFRLDGSDRRAVASWVDGKMNFVYLVTRKGDRYFTQAADNNGLKAWIKGE